MSAQANTPTQSPAINGVQVDQVLSNISAIEQDESKAAFQFRLDNKWVLGGYNQSRVQGFFALGHEDETRATPFVLDGDEPRINAGSDSAPNPMEYLLHSLAGCLTSTLVYHASVRGIEIGSVESSLEGDMDVRGMLGMSEEVRKGFSHVRVRMRVNSPESADTLKELALFSPVYDVVSRSLPVEVVLEKV